MSIRPLNQDDLLGFSLKTELAKDLRNIIIKYHLPHIKQQPGNAHFLVTNKYSLQNALNTYLVKLDKISDNTEEVITKEQINNLNEHTLGALKLNLDINFTLINFLMSMQTLLKGKKINITISCLYICWISSPKGNFRILP